MNIIGVDVGGTFTDVILIDMKTGRHYIHKLPSTPGNQEVAVIEGIQQLHLKYKLAPEEIALVVHGTTVATNAMLERKGSRVVLLTTRRLGRIEGFTTNFRKWLN